MDGSDSSTKFVIEKGTEIIHTQFYDINVKAGEQLIVEKRILVWKFKNILYIYLE